MKAFLDAVSVSVHNRYFYSVNRVSNKIHLCKQTPNPTKQIDSPRESSPSDIRVDAAKLFNLISSQLQSLSTKPDLQQSQKFKELETTIKGIQQMYQTTPSPQSEKENVGANLGTSGSDASNLKQSRQNILSKSMTSLNDISQTSTSLQGKSETDAKEHHSFLRLPRMRSKSSLSVQDLSSSSSDQQAPSKPKPEKLRSSKTSFFKRSGNVGPENAAATPDAQKATQQQNNKSTSASVTSLDATADSQSTKQTSIDTQTTIEPTDTNNMKTKTIGSSIRTSRSVSNLASARPRPQQSSDLNTPRPFSDASHYEKIQLNTSISTTQSTTTPDSSSTIPRTEHFNTTSANQEHKKNIKTMLAKKQTMGKLGLNTYVYDSHTRGVSTTVSNVGSTTVSANLRAGDLESKNHENDSGRTTSDPTGGHRRVVSSKD
jgi:hypothetical protein